MFSKNLTILLALVLFLTAGLSAGYLLGAKNTGGIKSENSNNDPANNTVVIKANLAAREAYDIAAREANQWSADAYLSGINLESKKFGADGLSNGWKIIFYSKNKNKSYEIVVKDGESRGGEEKAIVGEKGPQTLKGEMVDSAILAKSFYGSYPADTEIISLKMYYDIGAKKFIWTIFFPKGSHTVDAEI